jgi:hypothetical protein
VSTSSRDASRVKTLIGLLIFLILSYASYLLMLAGWRLFRGLQKEVAAALVAGTATVLVSVASVTVGRVLQRRQESDQAIREQKIPMYEEFVGFWFGYMMSAKTGSTPTTEEVLDFMRRFTQTLMVWGSDDVIKLWSEWRKPFASGNPPEGATALFEFEKLLLAIRREFGHKNKGLETGSLLGLFVNDLPAGP